MGSHEAGGRWWLVGYVLLLFGTLPLARPCWSRYLQDSVGRFIAVEPIHLAQYAGLGWMAEGYARAVGSSRRRRGQLVALMIGVGWLDETVQGYLPQRVFEWSDVGLNACGVVIGFLLRSAADRMSAWVKGRVGRRKGMAASGRSRRRWNS